MTNATLRGNLDSGDTPVRFDGRRIGGICIFCSLLAMTAVAAPTVTITGVAQRWPWNNKVDITYTVTDGQTRASGVYCGLRFAVTANGQTYNFEGYTVGASAENGQHTVTWTPPEGIVSDACSLTATLFSTNFPSGNDYMIVDLLTGGVIYEGLMETQDLSNERYTNAVYKTDKLVLRKVPRWADRATLPNAASLPSGGYPTGDSVNYSSDNSNQKWKTDRDYYIGVFPVTQKQYVDIFGENPSAFTGEQHPVEQVSWNDLRLAGTASTSSIPAVVSNDEGKFFQRLNYKTGLYFDLPTEVMGEIAVRAGTTTTYYWGESTDASTVARYAVCGTNSTAVVGSRLPNDWGLYDMVGNVMEWYRDYVKSTNLAENPDAFTPVMNVSNYRRNRSGAYNATNTQRDFRSSRRVSASPSTANSTQGFRVSLIVE